MTFSNIKTVDDLKAALSQIPGDLRIGGADYYGDFLPIEYISARKLGRSGSDPEDPDPAAYVEIRITGLMDPRDS